MTTERTRRMTPKHYSLVLALTGLISSCALPPIPSPTDNTAIIKLYAQPGRSLMADKLDYNWVNDGRYFEVTEGEHRLSLIFQYDATETTGLFSNNSSNITCIITLNAHFEPNKIYILEARPLINRSQLLLTHNNQTEVLDSSQVNSNCMPY